jgi:hypothetical protein
MKTILFKLRKAFCVLLALLVGGYMLSGCKKNQDGPLIVEYYYYNTCASCEPEKEFLEDFEAIAGISQVTTDVEIKTHNVFTNEGEKAWKKTAKKFGVSQDVDFPVLKIDSEIIYISDIPTKEYLEDKKVSVIAFISADCTACTEAGDSIISNIPDKVTIDGVDIATNTRVITLTTSDDKELFKEYCNAYHVKEEMRVTPIVFVGKAALSGADEISKLSEFIENSMALEMIGIQ